MITPRRSFLRLSAVSAAAAVCWPASEVAKAGVFEPSRFDRDDGVICLNSNENAYGPSPKVLDAIKASLGSVNRYPRMRYKSLIEQIADAHHVAPDRVLLGCGSTEILRVAALAFLGKGRQLIQASPTFEAMERYARATGAEVLPVRLTAAFAHDLDGMLARVSASTGIVYICNPNNPTSSLTPREDLETFISKLPATVVVVVDEAYHHYAGTSGMYASFIDRAIDDERVFVTRTFSKVYGLAGLRLGYAVAASKIIEQMRKFSTEDNINAVVTQAGATALDDKDGITESIRRNLNDRQEFFNQAMARALKPIDSHTNFVMMDTFHPAEDVIEHFRKNNILIGRRFPAMATHIRVSLGRAEEMQAFWQAWDTLPYPKNRMAH